VSYSACVIYVCCEAEKLDPKRFSSNSISSDPMSVIIVTKNWVCVISASRKMSIAAVCELYGVF